MNPEDEANAKKLFMKKVHELSDLLSIEIPAEIYETLKKEKNLKSRTVKHEFEVEVFGAARKWMTLHIK